MNDGNLADGVLKKIEPRSKTSSAGVLDTSRFLSLQDGGAHVSAMRKTAKTTRPASAPVKRTQDTSVGSSKARRSSIRGPTPSSSFLSIGRGQVSTFPSAQQQSKRNTENTV